MTHSVIKAYKYRLYPNRDQQELIEKTFGCCRFVYNYYLAKSIEDYENTGKSSSCYDNQKDLTQLKKEEEYSWLKEVDSQALNASIYDLSIAYKNFFNGLKSNKFTGYPKFKKKSNRYQSYYVHKTNENHLSISNDTVVIPKLGKVKLKYHRPISGRVVSGTISRVSSGKYFISLTCTDSKVDYLDPAGSSIGLDMGLKDLAITSDGELFENPRWFRKSQKKLSKLQKQHSRKKPGSKNREKSRLKVAKQFEKIVNQRKDYLHKLSMNLIKNHDLICIEDLNVKGMMKNKNLSKPTADASWGEFIRQLEYKADWYGRRIIRVDRFFPSSQLCSCCGYRNTDMKDLSIRSWTCPQCNTNHDRDVNAANNLLKEGLRILSA